MKIKTKSLLSFTLLVLMIVLVGCSSDASENKEDINKESADGGELRVALSSSPPTLDQPTSTATVVRDTARLLFETLYTNDADYKAVPMLAESVEISDDNKEYTFTLRKGVKFHNDKEMTAEDVVASMYRWVEKSSVTADIFDGATFEVEDDYTVKLKLAEPSIHVLDTIATSKMAAAIMPKEVIESASPTEGVSDYIGTGPFKFVEWKADQYIHVTKFDDYQSLEGEVSGLSGKKEALVDDIYFDIVTDAATRLAGLQTGLYDVAYSMAYDNYEQLENDPNLNPALDKNGEFLLFYNKTEGPASNFKIREAINTALDSDEIMQGTFINEDIYWMSPGYMTKSITNWASEEGSEFYNQNNQEKAKEILKEIGYNNEEFKIMTTRDFPHFYSAAIIIQEQLKGIGMNVVVEVYDWPTVMDKQTSSLGDWDALIIGSSTVSAPTQLLGLSDSFGGGVNDDKTEEMLRAIGASTTQEEAKQLWDELQGYSWEEHLPMTVLGGFNTLFGSTSEVEGLKTFSGPVFWNTKVTE